MRTVIVAILCLAAGLTGGAWSARGEIGELRDQTERLRDERDRAKRAKSAADLAMIARLGQVERACEPGKEDLPPRPVPAPPAPPPVPPHPEIPMAPDGSPPSSPHGFPPEGGRQAFDDFAEDAELSDEQRADVERLSTEFQRELEEAVGGAIARFAFAEATGKTPRPRDMAVTADGLLHTYLEADERLRALLDEDQVELLDDSEFDVLWLVDFQAIERVAQRSRPAVPE